MHQRLSREQFKFIEKTQKIKCKKHSKPIFALNVSKTSSLEERIRCYSCNNSELDLMPLYQVEPIMYKWYKQQVNEEYQINQLINTLDYAKKTFLEIIQTLQNKLKSITESFNQSKIHGTPIQTYINAVTNPDPLSASILQNLAEFISKCNIKCNYKRERQTSLTKYLLKIDNQIEKIVDLCSSLISPNSFCEKQQQSQPLFIQEQVQYRLPIQLHGHLSRICSVALSHNERLMASGDQFGTILIWNLLNKKQIKEFYGSYGIWITELLFSKDQKYLAVTQDIQRYQGDLFLFKLDQINRSPSIRLKGHFNIASQITFTADSQHIISGSSHKTLKIWNINQQTQVSSIQLSSFPNNISLSQNDQMMAFGCHNGQAYLFYSKKIKQLKQLAKWEADKIYVLSTLFLPNSQSIITSHYKQIKIWFLNSLKNVKLQRIFTLDIGIGNVKDVFNGQVLMTQTVNFFNIKIGERLNNLVLPEESYPESEQYYFSPNIVLATSDMKYVITKNIDIINIYEKIDS